jgi:hypothetical protein
MSKLSYFTLQLLAGAFLMTSAFAQDSAPKTDPAKEETDHIEPGIRALSHAERVRIQEERANEEKDTEEEKQGEESEESKDALQTASVTKAGIYFTTHPGAFYSPAAISVFGDSVELNDGSLWSIASGDTYKVLNWLSSDAVVLTPNHDWFSSYMFRMTNQDTGVSVKCNMVLGPVYNGIYTHWIIAIDYVSNEIYLDDGTRWSVTGWDSSTFNKWLPNDTVMIGINDGSRSGSHPNILINVNTLTYVRSICN